MAKPFIPLTVDSAEKLPGHMGVFELATDAGEVVYIGYAGGRSLFGLRGEIGNKVPHTTATCFRFEITTAYLTRYRELLMRHVASTGDLPKENDATSIGPLGRLSPG